MDFERFFKRTPATLDEIKVRVMHALERHPLFISAALPNLVYPPMFNRYGEGMTFGAHVDGGVRIDPRTGRKLRTDISATLFLSDPADYDGGELEIADTYGAGDSFAAALCFALARGDELEDAVALAARAGASVVTGTGPYEQQISTS